jgi:hypothetical protein
MKGALAHALVRSGEQHEARTLVEELERLSRTRYISPYSIGTVYAALGETNLAFDWLRRAIDTRSVWLIHLHVSADPRLSSLRGDPRCPALLKEIGVAR